MSELFSLRGKRALITGATRGIGLAIARQLGQSGAVVGICGERSDECVSVTAALINEGIKAFACAADLRSRESVETMLPQAIETLGGIDILVCNAGVAPHLGELTSVNDEDWNATFDVNLRSSLWLAKAILPQMSARGGGSVILMGSIAGVRGNKSLGLYALSKAAVAQMARNLAVEWGPQNIRVNTISPGLIDTEFARPLTQRSDVLGRRLALTPLRRVGRVEEVAGVAHLLASQAGAFITGQNIIVDGGTTITDGN